MGGKSKSTTIGYWYKLLYHMGLGIGPIDAFLEFRGGNKTAWSGSITASGTIAVNAPNLWGGEKDQGGIQGNLDVMFGEATQAPNARLLANLGDQVPGWRGLATVAYQGRYGAMNPYPQKAAYKFMKIAQGWDDPGCWYPDKASISLIDSAVLPADADGWEYQTSPQEANPGYTNLDIPSSGWLENGQGAFGQWDGTLVGVTINTTWPAHTVLWVRRTITASSTGQQDLIVSAENGALIFINGALVGAINRSNAQLVDQPPDFHFPIAAGATFDLAIKAFDEDPSYNGTNTLLNVQIVSAGLIAMNPAHILYYARTQQHMGREPTASMADANWRTAADWFFAQGIGLCTSWDPSQESADDFTARICKVAGCSVNRSSVDGLWYIDIANGVYDLASLPILTDDDILEWSMQPSTLDVAVNSVTVTYTDPQLKQDRTAPPVQALGLVDTFGTINQSTDYKEVPAAALAARIAARDLLASVAPKHAFDLTTARKPYGWRRNTYFRLQAPKHGIADMVCVVGDTGTGTLKSGAITLSALEDVYSLPATSFVQAEPGVDTRPSPVPAAIAFQAAFEAPYVELVRTLSRADLDALPADAGYLLTVAKDPAQSRDYTLTVSTDGGSTYAGNGTVEWCPTALIVEGDALTNAAPATAFTLASGALLASVAVGSAALWDSEIVRVDAIDATASTLTLGRGCADTPPMPHDPNSRIWFFDGFAGTDAVEYTNGESIDVELLTNTGTAQLDPLYASYIGLTFSGRQAAPYPPSGLVIAGTAWNTSVDASTAGAIALSWAERNRQSQADQLVDASMATITPPDGITYTVRTYLAGSLVNTQTGIAAPQCEVSPGAGGNVRVEIDSVFGGLTSLMPLAWNFAYNVTNTQPYADVVMADAPIGYWRLGEASGTTAADSSGNGYNGTYVSCTQGAASLVANANGDLAVQGNGTSSQITVGDVAALVALTRSFSVEAWIKPANVGANSGIWSAGYLGFCMRRNGTTIQVLSDYSVNIGEIECKFAAGTVYHVVGTVDANGLFTVWVNNAIIGTLNAGSYTFKGSYVRIGADGSNATTAGAFLDGELDEVAVYDAVLTASQIANHFAAGAPGAIGYGINYGNFYGGVA